MLNQIQSDFPNAVFFSFAKIKSALKPNGKIDKQLVGLPLHSQITKTTIVDSHKAFAMKTGLISGVSVLDIDSVDVYEQLIQRFDYLESCYKVRTRKGYHFYFNYDSRLKNNSNCMDEYEGVDIRNDTGFIICPPTKYKLPDGEIAKYKLIGGQIIDFPPDLFALLNHRGIVGEVKPVAQKNNNKNEQVDEIANVTNNKKYPIHAIKSLIDLLKPERCENRDQWIIVGIIIHQNNSTSEGFELFKQFSRMGKYKLSDNELTKTWNTFNKNYKNITIGTLKYFARTDNVDGYELLPPDLFGEQNHFTTTDINQQYLLLGESTELVKTHLNDWMTDDDFKLIAFKSAYNTGKTQTLHHIIEKYQPPRILFISYRQALTYNMFGNFTVHNVRSYLDSHLDSDRLICQVDSLPKLIHFNYFTNCYDVPEYDLIVMDEIESLLNHTESPTIRHQLGTFNVLDALLRKCKKIIALDGDFGNRSYDYLKTVNKNEDFLVIKNSYVPAVKHWHFINSKEAFDLKLSNDLESGKKVYMCCMASEMASKYNEMFGQYKVLVHSSKSDDNLKEELKNVNSFWTKYDLVMSTPSVESGVDFNVDHFDKLYVVLSEGSTSQRGLCQMANRVRNLKDLNVECYLNGLTYREKANVYTFDEVDIMFNKHLTSTTDLVVNTEGNLESAGKAFTTVNKYNYLESLNKNKFYFVAQLVQMLKQKGQQYSYNEIVDVKNPKSDNLTKQKIVDAEDINATTYQSLLMMQKRNEASQDDKFAIEKYLYKLNWELKTIDTDVMKKIYRKTHILYNNKAINNLPSKSFESIDPDYQDVSLKVKQQKLKIVNELLQHLKLKNDKNEFVSVPVENNEWETLVEKSHKKCTIFNDPSVLPLFDMSKGALKKITSNKSYLGFLNSILKNYSVKIVLNRSNKKDKDGNKINYYSTEQIQLL